MNRLQLLSITALAAIGVARTERLAQADNVELRIATLAPSGSPWMEVLDKANSEIKDKTAGRVTLKYFEGGQQGDEKDFVRKIKLGQLDGAAVTSIGLAMIDDDWYRFSRPAILAATPVRIAPAEELLWHRLFISERHRQDMADIVHLIICVGSRMEWKRIVAKTGEHWPLLLAQIQMFDYVYPQHRDGVPRWVRDELLDRARADMERERTAELVTRGPIISRFSFTIDVHEWEMKDLREEIVNRALARPLVREIAESDVWDERSEQVEDFLS